MRGPQAVEAAAIGDFLVRRADGGAVFFFCNAVDDALMGVTHVLRGDDHLSNTPRQLLLLRALGLPVPRYGHLPLLLDAGGAPQSKRRGSVTVAALRERGYLAAALGNYLLRLGHHGAPDDWVDPQDMPRHFHVDKLGRAPAHFDPVQLDHWQREAVLRLDAGTRRAGWPRSSRRTGRTTGASRVAALLQGNVLLPRDARDWLAVLGGTLPPLPADAANAIVEAGPAFFDAALASFGETGGNLGALVERLKSRTGRKGKALFMPLRFALTGRHDGPELAALLAAMPQALVRDRLESAAHAARTPEMPLRIHNSMTGRKEALEPLEPGHVRMYVCGITVYDHIHVGHARSQIAFDVARRWLRASRLPRHLRAQHHRHRRQDHRARARARRADRGAHRALHRVDGRGLRRDRPREAGPRAARDRVHPRDRRR